MTDYPGPENPGFTPDSWLRHRGFKSIFQAEPIDLTWPRVPGFPGCTRMTWCASPQAAALGRQRSGILRQAHFMTTSKKDMSEPSRVG